VTAPPFVVFALPRSRTKWLSTFLTYGEWHCGHDEIRHCRSLDDVTSWLSQPCTGTVETAAAPFWRLLERYAPEARVVTLRRPVEAVAASLARAGLMFEDPVMLRLLQRIEAKLDQIEARVPNVLRVTFDDLATEASCAAVFEHCLQMPHDPAWWAHLAPLNLQTSLPVLMRYYAAHRPQLAKLAKQARHRTMAGMMQRAPEIDGITFQHEPFRQFYADAGPLFAEHLVQTGQSPDDHALKNLPLLELLDDAGLLQTMTARSNGRMFGYLMTALGPTLDAEGVTQGWHTIFFVSPDMPGLGMKLQRAALDGLRERGVDEVVMRAGHRGSGPRLGTFYRRLGAEPFGELYKLELN
jgi:GNAT superfamily N-acetyltransferase